MFFLETYRGPLRRSCLGDYLEAEMAGGLYALNRFLHDLAPAGQGPHIVEFPIKL